MGNNRRWSRGSTPEIRILIYFVEEIKGSRCRIHYNKDVKNDQNDWSIVEDGAKSRGRSTRKARGGRERIKPPDRENLYPYRRNKERSPHSGERFLSLQDKQTVMEC